MEKREAIFQDWLKQYEKLILKVAYAYVSQEVERQDLIQEILIQIWRTLPRYDASKAQVSTWIYRIALNVAISFKRKEATKKRKEESIQTIVDYSIDSDTEEQLSRLYQAIETLKPLDKALIILYLDGCKQEEMAEIMGISKTNVSTKILRIKKKLQTKLN